MNSLPKSIISGATELRSAVALLEDLVFDPICGAIRECEQLIAIVTPTWCDQASTYVVRVTCLARWHQKVSWETLRLVAHPLKASAVPIDHVAAFNPAGHAVFTGLTAEAYQLSVRHRLAMFTTPGTPSRKVQPTIGIAMGMCGSRSGMNRVILRHDRSDFGDVIATIGHSDGRVFVEFATKDLGLAGKTIEFCISGVADGALYGGHRSVQFRSDSQDGEFRSNVDYLGTFDPGREVELTFRLLGRGTE
jgi:hypothetical protein